MSPYTLDSQEEADESNKGGRNGQAGYLQFGAIHA